MAMVKKKKKKTSSKKFVKPNPDLNFQSGIANLGYTSFSRHWNGVSVVKYNPHRISYFPSNFSDENILIILKMMDNSYASGYQEALAKVRAVLEIPERDD